MAVFTLQSIAVRKVLETVARDVCMDFGLCFKVFNLVSVNPKSIKLGQMTIFDVIFHVVVSVSILLKLAPAQFRSGL